MYLSNGAEKAFDVSSGKSAESSFVLFFNNMKAKKSIKCSRPLFYFHLWRQLVQCKSVKVTLTFDVRPENEGF